MSGAFLYINAINASKDVIGTKELDEKNYDPFITNRNYSLFVDTIMYSNEINKCYQLDNKLQFDYYLNSIRPSKRFVKWPKKERVEDIDVIMIYYKVNYNRALEISRVLTADQKDYLKTKIIKGGANDSK